VTAAWATWRAGKGDRSLIVTGDHDDHREPVALIPLPDDGRPTTGVLDDLLATLGYTRTSPWSESLAHDMSADVEPIRPDGPAATGYPRRDEHGRTVWACCESTIGPPCGHLTPPDGES
jgi:hypothetical protein